jgi:hypothetical protein
LAISVREEQLISGLCQFYTPPPPQPRTARESHTDSLFIARQQRAQLALRRFLADTLPIAHTEYGCVQLAACFGAEPKFDNSTVWYTACIDNPDEFPPLALTKTEPWWLAYKQLMLAVRNIS